MRAAVVVGLAVCASAELACSDQPGLTLSVNAGAHVTQLRVLVSDRTCNGSSDPEELDGISDCSGMSLVAGTQEVPGHIRFVDDGSAEGSSLAADPVQQVDDDGFVIRLLPNPSGSVRPIHLALIGFDANDKALTIGEMVFDTTPQNELTTAPVREEITLAPLAETGGTSGATSVTLARGPGSDYVCVEIDNAPAVSGTTLPNEFFVPVVDPDCDGILIDKECKPYLAGFKGSTGGSSSDVGTCATDSSAGSGGPSCVLGAGESACIDGDGPMPPLAGCDPLDANTPAPCLPSGMCNPQCGADLDPDSCFGDDFGLAENMAHIECVVQFDQDNGTPCDGYFDASVFGTDTTQPGDCTIALQEIGNGDIALDGFGTQAQFIDASGAQDAVTMIEENATGMPSACDLGVAIPPTTLQAITSNQVETLAYAQLAHDTGSGRPGATVVLPMLLQYPQGGGGVDCTMTPTECKLELNGDGAGLLACVGLDVATGSGSGL